jgi:hypothetical protein
VIGAGDHRGFKVAGAREGEGGRERAEDMALECQSRKVAGREQECRRKPLSCRD